MNPGRSANKLHKQFSEKIGEDSLDQIRTCVTLLGGKYKVHGGFKERNGAVARDSQYLIAFTWNDDKIPKKSSGTYDTWQKHTGKKIHIPISSLVDAKETASLESTSSSVELIDGPGFSGEPSASCSSIEGSVGEASASCISTEGGGNPKWLQHQSESTDSGCCSWDSQSSLESPSCSSCRGQTNPQQGYRTEDRATLGAKRKDTLDQSGGSKRPRLDT